MGVQTKFGHVFKSSVGLSLRPWHQIFVCHFLVLILPYNYLTWVFYYANNQFHGKLVDNLSST